MDVVHNKVLGSIATGDGLDNIDYAPVEKRLYAAASVAGTLTIAKVDGRGTMTTIATVLTAKGSRSVIAGEGATAYVIDPVSGSILKVVPG